MLIGKSKQKENFKENRLVFEHAGASKEGSPSGTLEGRLGQTFYAKTDIGDRLGDNFIHGGPDKEIPGLIKEAISGVTGGVRKLVGGTLETVGGLAMTPVKLGKGLVRRVTNLPVVAPSVAAGIAGKVVGETGVLAGKIIKPITGTISKVYETLTEAIPNFLKRAGRKVKPADKDETHH